MTLAPSAARRNERNGAPDQAGEGDAGESDAVRSASGGVGGEWHGSSLAETALDLRRQGERALDRFALALRDTPRACSPGSWHVLGPDISSVHSRSMPLSVPVNTKWWNGSTAYQYSRPSTPFASNVAVCRTSVPSPSGTSSYCSQPRPGMTISATSRSSRGESTFSTRHHSSTSPSMSAYWSRRPRRRPGPAEQDVEEAADVPQRVERVPAVLAADARDRIERRLGRACDSERTRVDVAAFALEVGRCTGWARQRAPRSTVWPRTPPPRQRTRGRRPPRCRSARSRGSRARPRRS